MDSNNTQSVLFAKIAKVMGEVKRVPKSGFNQHFKYSFATEGDISDMIRDLLAENNVALLASLVSWKQDPQGNTLKTICDFQFTLACGDTGATYNCMWTAEANDNQDKGFNKAATAALKYWLLKTFMIPTGEDPDGDEPAPKASKGKTAAPTQQPTQKPDPFKSPTPKPEAASAGGKTPQGEAVRIDHSTGQIVSAESITPDPQRNARLQNEEIVITEIVHTGTVTSNSEKAKNGDKYDGFGMIEDGGMKHRVRVWIFPEDVTQIKAHGYDFGVGKGYEIPVIMDTSDRAMTRIGSVLPNANQPDRKWDAAAWDAVKEYVTAKGLKIDDLNDILGVSTGGAWKRGYRAAIATIDAYVGVDFDAMPKASGQ